MDDAEIYRPEIITEKPLKLDPELTGYATILQAAMEGGSLPVKLDEPVVRQRISNELYANASSGLRELFANEMRACHTAEKEHGAKPWIDVTINPLTRKLSIQGHDSMGISQELFVNVVRYLGRSDNFSGTEPGQFGFGLAAYTCLSDVMILETYSRKTGERFAVMGKGGVGFDILPEPKMESFGTRITITLMKEITINELLVELEKFAMFCGIDVSLVVEKRAIATNWRTFSEGVHALKRMTFEERLEDLVHSSNIYNIVQSIPVEIHEDDYELYGRFAFCQYRDARDTANEKFVFLDHTNLDKVLLLGLPVQTNLGLPFSHYILNILNERKYKPTPDRERLAQTSVDALKTDITKKLIEFFGKDEIRHPGEYATHKHRRLYRNRQFDNIRECLTERARAVLDFVDTRIVTYAGERTTIGDAMKPGTKLVRLASLKGNSPGVLQRDIPNSVIFRFVPHNNAAAVRMLGSGKCGVIDGNKYLRDNGIDANKEADVPKYVVVHMACSQELSRWHEPMRVMSNKLGRNIIRVPKNRCGRLHEIMKTTPTNYKTVVDDKHMKSGITYDSFIKRSGLASIHTSDGVMTVREAAESGKTICLVEYDLPEGVGKIESNGPLIAMAVANDIFQIVAFLEDCGVKYVIDRHTGRDGHLFRALGFDAITEITNESKFSSYCGIEHLLRTATVAQSIRDEQIKCMLVRLVNKHGMDIIPDMHPYVMYLDDKISRLQKKL